MKDFFQIYLLFARKCRILHVETFAKRGVEKMESGSVTHGNELEQFIRNTLHEYVITGTPFHSPTLQVNTRRRYG